MHQIHLLQSSENDSLAAALTPLEQWEVALFGTGMPLQSEEPLKRSRHDLKI
jgi:hypothetical protein